MQYSPQASGEVVELFPHRMLSDDPNLSALESHWNNLRTERLIPYRSDIDPRSIANCLEYAFVLERASVGAARFRLAGMHLNDVTKMDVKGLPLSCLFTPDARNDLGRTLARVFDVPTKVHLSLNCDRGFARADVAAQMVLLPMQDDLGLTTCVLGGLVCEARPMRHALRFSITATRESKPKLPGRVPHSNIQTEVLEIRDPARSIAALGFSDQRAAAPSRSSNPVLRLVASSDS